MAERVVIVVPFREDGAGNRTSQLRRLLSFFETHVPRHAKANNMQVRVLVVEQSEDGYRFNKGQVMNAGYAHASAQYSTNSSSSERYIFHDVDMVPSDETLAHYFTSLCRPCPRRSCDKAKGKVVRVLQDANQRYDVNGCFGGVLVVDSTQFAGMNGFPNDFWGWGGEDNAFFARVVHFFNDAPAVNSDNDTDGDDDINTSGNDNSKNSESPEEITETSASAVILGDADQHQPTNLEDTGEAVGSSVQIDGLDFIDRNLYPFEDLEMLTLEEKLRVLQVHNASFPMKERRKAMRQDSKGFWKRNGLNNLKFHVCEGSAALGQNEGPVASSSSTHPSEGGQPLVVVERIVVRLDAGLPDTYYCGACATWKPAEEISAQKRKVPSLFHA